MMSIAMRAESPVSASTYAKHLLRLKDELSRQQLKVVQAALPELGDVGLAELEIASAAANLESFAVVVQHGMHDSFAPPLAATALARRLAWTDVSIDVLVRAYRLGHEWVYEDIRQFCAAECTDSGTAVELLGELGQLAFRFTDACTTSVIAEYERERETLLRSDLAERHSHVRAVLSGQQVDLRGAERALGYHFDGIHVAFRTWVVDTREDGPRVVGQVMRDVTAAMTVRGSLTVQDAPGLATTWLRSAARAELESAAAAALATQSGVRIAIGNPAAGVQGFRDTYRQAERARAIGRVSPNGVVAYADVSLLSLLLENPESARTFVQDELGGLAAQDANTAKLRCTLLAFLEHQCRHLPTAQALYMHRNTVAQQVHRAKEILEREVTVRTLELQTALRLLAYFDATQNIQDTHGPDRQEHQGPDFDS